MERFDSFPEVREFLKCFYKYDLCYDVAVSIKRNVSVSQTFCGEEAFFFLFSNIVDGYFYKMQS